MFCAHVPMEIGMIRHTKGIAYLLHFEASKGLARVCVSLIHTAARS